MTVPTKDLAALGLTPDMVGAVERLALPLPVVDEARGPRAPRPDDVTPDPEWLEARSDVLHAIGLDMQFDPDNQLLQFASASDLPFRIRGAHPHSTPSPATSIGTVELALRQLGHFLIETETGAPLAIGVHEAGTISLAGIGPWPSPPIEDWISRMNDTWLQEMVTRTLLGADTWSRTALAGTITRLAEPVALDDPPRGLDDLLARVTASPAMHPRAWARTLDPRALDAIEQHALRRAMALAGDLEDLLVVLPRDAEDARDAWTKLCHRRDDIEGVRLLLREAGSGAILDDVLRDTDRAGRSARVNLGSDIETADERLRRVALGDPGAWWGDTAFEVRLV